jgi:phosphatidylethanolamine-binding protein (PEBP) family uncharacterized protein
VSAERPPPLPLQDLDSPTRDQVEAGMQGHILATGELVVTYQREAIAQ